MLALTQGAIEGNGCLLVEPEAIPLLPSHDPSNLMLYHPCNHIELLGFQVGVQLVGYLKVLKAVVFHVLIPLFPTTRVLTLVATKAIPPCFKGMTPDQTRGEVLASVIQFSKVRVDDTGENQCVHIGVLLWIPPRVQLLQHRNVILDSVVHHDGVGLIQHLETHTDTRLTDG